MGMRRLAALLGAGLLLALVLGCGGGGATPDLGVQGETVQTLRIDFVNGTVTVIETPVDSAAKVDTHPSGGSPDMELTLAVLAEETGNPGYRHVDATITNNGSSAIGVNAEGVETGVDLCVTSLVFYKADMSTVEGGGMGGYYSYNALTDLPVYRIEESVAVGATSNAVTLSFQLPKNTTTADVGIEVRADSATAFWPAPGDRYVTTVAGHPMQSSYVNGPLSAARFYYPGQLLVREGHGDVLVADNGNGAVRKIDDDTVSTVTAGTIAGPMGIAEDPAGNLIVSAYNGDAVYAVSSSGGTVGVIAGTGVPGDVDGMGNVAQFDNPSFLATIGDDTYVTDEQNRKLKRITYDGTGSRFSATNYTVSSLYTSTTMLDGVAADHNGNVFFSDFSGHQVRVRPAGQGTTYVIAGTGALGTDDGRGDLATLFSPATIAVDEAGTLYVAEWERAVRRIRRIGPDITQATNWKVETLIGYGTAADGGDASELRGIRGIDVAKDGTLWITDVHAVRRIDRLVH